MIYSNLQYVENYKFLPRLIKKALDYAQNTDMSKLAPGSYEIEGKDLYVNIAEYTTCTRGERFWEAHREYVDIHFLITGEEYIDVKFLPKVETGEYKAEDDFLAIKASGGTTVEMQPGDFLICNPEEAHQTGVQITSPVKLKKGIFKVRVAKLGE